METSPPRGERRIEPEQQNLIQRLQRNRFCIRLAVIIGIPLSTLSAILALYGNYIWYWIVIPLYSRLKDVVMRPVLESIEEGFNGLAKITKHIINDITVHKDEYFACAQNMGMSKDEIQQELEKITGDQMNKIRRKLQETVEMIIPISKKAIVSKMISYKLSKSKEVAIVDSSKKSSEVDLINEFGVDQESLGLFKPFYGIDTFDYFMTEELPRPPDMSFACKNFPEGWFTNVEECEQIKKDISIYKQEYGSFAYECPNIYKRTAIEYNTILDKIIGSVDLQRVTSLKLLNTEFQNIPEKLNFSLLVVVAIFIFIIILTQFNILIRRCINRNRPAARFNSRKASKRKSKSRKASKRKSKSRKASRKSRKASKSKSKSRKASKRKSKSRKASRKSRKASKRKSKSRKASKRNSKSRKTSKRKSKSRKTSKRKYITKKACNEFLKEKISINMGEFPTRAQAVAVSYSQTNKKFPRCSRFFKKSK